MLDHPPVQRDGKPGYGFRFPGNTQVPVLPFIGFEVRVAAELEVDHVPVTVKGCFRYGTSPWVRVREPDIARQRIEQFAERGWSKGGAPGGTHQQALGGPPAKPDFWVSSAAKIAVIVVTQCHLRFEKFIPGQEQFNEGSGNIPVEIQRRKAEAAHQHPPQCQFIGFLFQCLTTDFSPHRDAQRPSAHFHELAGELETGARLPAALA